MISSMHIFFQKNNYDGNACFESFNFKDKLITSQFLLQILKPLPGELFLLIGVNSDEVCQPVIYG